MQAFYEFFNSDSVPGPKRLVAFTVYGSTYYAGPGAHMHAQPFS